jgi:hypothetical protein
LLLAGETRLFEVRGATSGAGSFPPGSAFRVAKGTNVRLLFKVRNLGPPGETQGANALIYFVPTRDN